MKDIQILLIEDNKIMQNLLLALLKKHSDITAISTIMCDEKTVTNLIAGQKTDIVILDLGLPNQDNLNLIKSIKRNSNRTRIIVMNLIPSQIDFYEYVQAGVSGFMSEDISEKDFSTTIRSVHKGINILPPYLVEKLFSQISKDEFSLSNASAFNKTFRLTKREKQVMGLISDGCTNKEIAQTLRISVSTAKTHVHNILEKLSVNTRVQIAKHTLSSDPQNQK